jgi:UDP-glucuronate 4-epimerase
MSEKQRVLISGSAGFIGSNLMSSLMGLGYEVFGIDSYSDYYDKSMKISRETALHLSGRTKNLDICNRIALGDYLGEIKPNIVVNLAAQGGVRASRTNPTPYLESNQIGFLNMIELSRDNGVEKFLFASSSSVYGDSVEAPFSEDAELSAPKSLYALSKMSNELIAKHLDVNDMSVTGLRFFTVYGPWGRPDMAMFRLLTSAKLGLSFELTASPSVKRDFTFVDDVSSVIAELISSPTTQLKFGVLNVSGGKPYSLGELFGIISELGLDLQINQAKYDELDVRLTHGSVSKLRNMQLPVPSTSLADGVSKTLNWIDSLSNSDLLKWFEYSKNG